MRRKIIFAIVLFLALIEGFFVWRFVTRLSEMPFEPSPPDSGQENFSEPPRKPADMQEFLKGN